MDKVELNELLQQVAAGEISPDDAALKLKMEPIKEVGEYESKIDLGHGVNVKFKVVITSENVPEEA